MRKFIFSAVAAATTLFPLAPAGAQGMMGAGTTASDDGHTAREEAEGKVVWEKTQNKELACTELTDENYAPLGEYFMGLMAGNAHAAMNAMMTRMMGEEGEEQMHVLMGKRLSGCAPDADAPLALSSGVGMMGGTGMMSMMMGGGAWGGMMTPWSRQLSGGAALGLGVWMWLWALVWFVNSVLLGVFLWALIKKYWKK